MLKLKSVASTVVKVANDPIKIKAFRAANEAMAELFTAGVVGNTCVRQKFLNTSMVQSLSKTCFTILLPLFLFTSIMKTIQANGGRLTSMTIMIPFIAIMHCCVVNLISKYCLLPLFQMEDESDEGRATLVSCMFGNSGVIPLIFAEALFRHNANALQKAYSIVSLYLVGWSPFFWSFGKSVLLGPTDDKSSVKLNRIINDQHDELPILSMIYEQLIYMKTLFPPPVIGVLSGLFIASIPFVRKLFLSDGSGESKPIFGVIYNCFQNLGRAANPLALLVLTSSLALGNAMKEDDDGDENNNVVIDKPNILENEGTENNSKINRSRKKKATMLEDKDDDNSDNEEMINPSILGKKDANTHFMSRLICVSIARFIISPTLMMMILQKTVGSTQSITFTKDLSTGMIEIKDEAMIWFVMMLQSCMPPAQNSVLMLQVAEKTKEASALAKFLFSIYTFAMVPIVILSTVLLEKCQLTQV